MQRWSLGLLKRAGAWLLLLGMCQVWAQAGAGGTAGSPHHNQAGFFDIHVCNWPDQPVFLMALFSTIRFNEIGEIEVFDPGHRSLGKLNLSRYRLVMEPGKAEKRVFIANIAVPQQPVDGWYSARVTMRSGEQFDARDYVAIGRLARASNLIPADGEENAPLPKELKWDAVPGAKYYQVFIKDLWDGERLIYTSAMLDEPRLVLPPRLLQSGGAYAWRVHARDVNDDPVLGDFNLGSLSAEVKFSVAQ